MIGIAFNALFSSFFLVRVVKGGWTRNPQYLAVALVSSMIALIGLHAWSPGAEDSLILGNVAALAGAWLGILLFDQIMDAA